MRKASHQELADSVRTLGLLVPIIRFNGSIYDGERRDQICRTFGIKVRTHDCTSRNELLQALWLFEPQRALKEAGKMSIAEYAEAFATKPLAVARVLRELEGEQPEKKVARVPDAGGSDKGLRTMIQFWISHRLKYCAQVAADLTRCNLSEFIRQAVQEKISRELDAPTRAAIDRAQLEGTEYRKRKLPR